MDDELSALMAVDVVSVDWVDSVVFVLVQLAKLRLISRKLLADQQPREFIADWFFIYVVGFWMVLTRYKPARSLKVTATAGFCDQSKVKSPDSDKRIAWIRSGGYTLATETDAGKLIVNSVKLVSSVSTTIFPP